MKKYFPIFLLIFVKIATAQNVGINVPNPDVNLTVLKDIRIDAENANNGTIDNSLRFGSDPSGEFIFSKRTAGGNQYGFDFFTAGFGRLTIANNGNIGAGVAVPEFKLSVQQSLQIDAEDSSNGHRKNSLLFGISYTGEYISSRRLSGGNQNGFDFYTANISRLTIGNNGNIAIGKNDVPPSAKLQLYKAGTYLKPEATNNHALEIKDTSIANNHVLYMGANAANGLSYIQAASNSGLWNLLLQGRAGDVYVGKDVQSNILVNGSVVVDNNFKNDGTLNYGLRFGAAGSGESIASNRKSGSINMDLIFIQEAA